MTHGIVKIYKVGDVPFTQIPNDLIRDPKISSNSVRLYAYLASHSQGYELTFEQIERQTDLGQSAIRANIGYLTDAGWLVAKRQRGKDGRLGRYDFHIYPARRDDSNVDSFQTGMTKGHIEEQVIKKNNVKEDLAQKAKRSKSAPFALPDGWQPKPETRDKFGTKWVKIEYESTLEAFIEFSLAKGSKWVDWDLAFQSWCRKAEGWAKPGPVHTMSREEAEIQDLLKRAKR